jgi:N-acetylneuraminic acid mutarotase
MGKAIIFAANNHVSNNQKNEHMKMKILLWAILVTSGFTSKAQWTQLGNLPYNVSGHCFFTIGNEGYICGGTSSDIPVNFLYEYNLNNDSWISRAVMPTPRSGFVSFVIDGKAYVTLGGSNSMDAYDPLTNSWSSRSSFPSIDRNESVSFVIGTDAYVGTGKDNDGNSFSDFYKYNSITNSWSSISNFPTNRSSAVSFSIDGKGYVGTGLINFNNPLESDLWEYNPINDSWIQKSSLPTPGRYAALGFNANGKGYIATGETYNPFSLLSDLWEYNNVTDTWIQLLPNYEGGGTNYSSGMFLDSSIYIGGGSPGWRNDFYVYSVNCANNTTISPLTNSIITGSTAIFTSSSTDSNPSYVWQSNFGQGYQTLNDVENYSGTNTSTLNISNIQLANHNQPIRVITTSGECVDTSDIATISILDTCITSINDTTFISVTDTLVINTLITGINPPNNSNTIKVYPNPANSHITIEYGDFAIMNGYQLRIENSLGQEVFQTNISQQSDYLNLNSWGGNGLYFVHIVDPQGNTIDIRKIVLQ